MTKSKKFHMELWGLKDEQGIVLFGHDFRPMTYSTEKDAIYAKNKTTIKYKVIRLVIQEK